MRPAKTQINLGIRPVWSESSLSASRNLGSLATHWAHSEDSMRLGGCPGWFESSLSAHSLCWFCHEAAHILFWNHSRCWLHQAGRWWVIQWCSDLSTLFYIAVITKSLEYNQLIAIAWSFNHSLGTTEYRHQIRASSQQKMSSGFPTWQDSNRPAQLQRLHVARVLKFRL